jgi:hypothetical protein
MRGALSTAATAAILALAGGSCLFQPERVMVEGAPCPCFDGWTCCIDVETCARDAADCPVASGAVAADSACQDPDAACLDPRDEPGGASCVRSDEVCNAVEPECPDGYQCNASNQCECSDIRACGRCCARDADCGPGHVCDLFLATCHPPLACASDASCASGEICSFDYFEDTVGDFLCRAPGPLAVGERCAADAECESGTCDPDICLERCASNADCDDAQQCVGAIRLACRREPYCTDCDGPDQLCTSGGCRERPCRTGADCDGHVCEQDQLYSDVRLCRDEPDICGGYGEYLYRWGGSVPFCLTDRTCWSDAECPAPLRCISFVIRGTDSTHLSAEIAGGICGRDP